MKLLCFAGAYRAASLNRRLIELAVRLAAADDVQPQLADFRDYGMPLYDGDLEEAGGVPDGAQKLARHIAEADAVMLSSPEYNHSIPGTLKNAVDWVSRVKPMPLKGKPMLLISASPGMVGGDRALWALRVPLESLGADVYPAMFSLSKADVMFAEDGNLTDERLQARLKRTIEEFLAQTRIIIAGGAQMR